MKILIVAATALELKPIQQQLKEGSSAHEVDFLVTGVGMISTTFQLTKKLLTEQYDLAINAGIAGVFDRTMSLGDVFEVVQDQFSEELIEDGSKVKTYQEIGLKKEDPILHSSFLLSHSTLIKVRGITVNTVHGNEKSIEVVQQRFNPQVESMEGAAFFYVCQQENVPSLQIRAISNYVEKRNRDAWEIGLALNNLADAIPTILKQL